MRIEVLSFLILFFSSSVFAQETVKQDTVSLESETKYEFPPVVVTATRTERQPEELGGYVTVIGKKKIEEMKPRDVAEILRFSTGTNISEYGSQGQLQTLSLRGASSGQNLILIDGRPLNDPDLGSADLSLLSLVNVDRIEIVRGGLSTLWGANAMGGVVQVFTKSLETKRAYSRVGAENSSYGGAKRFFEIGSSLGKKVDYYITGEARLNRGYRENSDYDGKNFSGKIQYHFTPEWKFVSGWGRYTGKLGVPGSSFFPSLLARQEDRRSEGWLELSKKSPDKNDFRVNIYGRETFRGYDNPEFFYRSSNRNKNYGGEIEKSFLYGDMHLITIGGRGLWNNSSGTYTGNHIVNEGNFFLQDEMDILSYGIFRIAPSIGFHRHSIYGMRLLPSFVLKLLNLHYSWQQSVRAPTVDELFWDDIYYKGNSALLPEFATSWEIGMGMNFGSHLRVSGIYFRRGVKDLIQSGDPDRDGIWSSFNIGRSRIEGWEWNWKLEIRKNLYGELNYTHQNAFDMGSGKRLIYQPKGHGTGYLFYNARLLHQKGKQKDKVKLGIRIQGEYFSDRVDEYGEILPPIRTLGMTFSLKIIDLSLFYGVDNIERVKYELRKGYPMPLKTYRAGLSWEFWD